MTDAEEFILTTYEFRKELSCNNINRVSLVQSTINKKLYICCDILKDKHCVYQLLKVMKTLHDNNIIHQDIKAENICTQSRRCVYNYMKNKRKQLYFLGILLTTFNYISKVQVRTFHLQSKIPVSTLIFFPNQKSFPALEANIKILLLK